MQGQYWGQGPGLGVRQGRVVGLGVRQGQYQGSGACIRVRGQGPGLGLRQGQYWESLLGGQGPVLE